MHEVKFEIEFEMGKSCLENSSRKWMGYGGDLKLENFSIPVFLGNKVPRCYW